jgi:tetratricopeptide (TPR) repeat protein
MRDLDLEEMKRAAYALFCQGRLGEAAAVFAKVAHLAPRDPYPHQALGAIYLSAGRALEAVLAYTQAIALSPGSPILHARRAEALARLGELGPALDDWAAALRLGGPESDGPARFARAALAAQGKRE